MDLEAKRLKLHSKLCSILGSNNVYYSPPTGMEFKYPCIVYSLDNNNSKAADNIQYIQNLSWEVTVIDEDPDSKVASKFFDLPGCRFERPFTSDDLNHFVFTLFD